MFAAFRCAGAQAIEQKAKSLGLLSRGVIAHETYGTGTIVSTSVESDSVTIDFGAEIGERMFSIEYGPLKKINK